MGIFGLLVARLRHGSHGSGSGWIHKKYLPASTLAEWKLTNIACPSPPIPCFKVLSSQPLYQIETTKVVHEHITSIYHKPFETMESLLMSISPMFREKFQEALYTKLADINDTSSSSDQQRQETQTDDGQHFMSQETMISMLTDNSTDALGEPNLNMNNM